MRGEITTRTYRLCFIVLWIAQMAAAFWFCTQKQGFHEDEYYTYYSTARTGGFYVEDGKWMDRDTYRNEFVVLPEQRFQYGLVKQVQSWDVHPPMYYWVFHTVASFVPGVFSKWIGLSVNLFFHGMNLILLTYLSYLVTKGDRKLSLLITFVYGFGPAAMSGVVFIRMYEMLTVFVLLCAVLHVRAVKRLEQENGGGKLSVWRELFPMAAVTYIGFLTQYYYFIFLFFMAAAFGLWLFWRDRGIGNCLRYGLFQAAAFVLAYLTYPSFPAQMFKGQRGAQATENFFDLSNTLERFRFFGDLLNRYVFGGWFFVLVLVFGAAAVCLRHVFRKGGAADAGAGEPCQERKREFDVSCRVLLCAVLGYFFAVSKTALLLGETSVRYQLPIYGIAVLLVFLAGNILWRRGLTPAFLLCIVMLGTGYRRSEVQFLYPEDKEQTAFAGQQAEDGALAVYLYHPGEEWCIWDVTNELLAYPAVYFAAVGTTWTADEKIEKAETLVVYAAKGTDREALSAGFAFLGGVSEGEPELIFEEKYCDVYSWRR